MVGPIIVFILVLGIIWYFKTCSHPKDFPPGPRMPLPFIGDAYVLGKDYNIGFTSLIRKYGKSVGLWLGSNRTVLVSDFDILQEILNLYETSDRAGLIEIESAGLLRGGLSKGGIPGVLFSNGKTWLDSRRTSLHVLRDFGFGKNTMEEMIDDELNKLVLYIDDQWLNSPLDVSQFFNISVLSSLWRIISGESLEIHDSKLSNICKMVQEAIQEAGNPFQVIASKSVPLLQFLNNIGYFQNINRMKNIIAYCNDAIKSCKGKEIDAENPLTFIEAMLNKIQKNNDVTDTLYGDLGELNLLNILIDFFIAGSDTTSNSLNWAMLFMITHPDIQSKVRQELLANVGMSTAKYSDRSLTPYTEAVLHEISRKGNILPMSVFHQANASLTIGQFKIPREATIVPMIGEIMHDPIHFPNPMEFNPERYLIKRDDGTLKFTPNPRVVPFGIGKRRCLGETLARTTLYKFFTAIIQRYEIISGQDEPILDTSTSTGFIQGPKPYKLKFIRVN